MVIQIDLVWLILHFSHTNYTDRLTVRNFITPSLNGPYLDVTTGNKLCQSFTTVKFYELTFTEVSSLNHEVFHNSMEETSFVVQGFLSSFANAFLTWIKPKYESVLKNHENHVSFRHVLVEKIEFSPVQRHLKFSQVLGQMSEKSSTTTLPTEERASLINFLYC